MMKTISKKLYLIVLIFFVNNAYSQERKFNIDDLLGKWNSYKVTTLKGDDGSEITFDGKPFRKKIMMNFINSKKMLFSINNGKEVKIDYFLKNNTITIAHRKYKVTSFKKGVLVLKEEKLLGNLIYFKKNKP